MRTKFKFFGIAVLITAIGLFSGCDGTGSPANGGTGGDVLSVSFTNHTVRPAIWVDNTTNERLVAFRGSVRPDTLMGGIPAFSGQHGLRRDPALFTANAAFPLLLITESDFEANVNNLGAAPVFARIFVFYNHTATNSNVFEISSRIGGEGRLNVSNPLSFNVELRHGGPTGEILGYAAAGMTQGNVLRINAPDFIQVYPVFVLFNPIEEEIFRVTPRFTSGRFEGRPYVRAFGFGEGALNHFFDLGDIQGEGTFGLSSGSAYLRIINNTSPPTALQFRRGGLPLYTSLGIPAINAGGRAETFTVNFSRNPDQTFPEIHPVDGMSIGMPGFWWDIPRHEFNLDYMYTLEVTGGIGNLQITAITRGSRVDLERMFGLN